MNRDERRRFVHHRFQQVYNYHELSMTQVRRFVDEIVNAWGVDLMDQREQMIAALHEAPGND